MLTFVAIFSCLSGCKLKSKSKMKLFVFAYLAAAAAAAAADNSEFTAGP